jgi:uncharacterized protein YhdP
MAAPDPDSPVGYLRQVQVRGASLTVEDHMLRASWRARQAAATLFRGERGMFGDLALAIDLGDAAAELHGEFQYSAPDQRLAVNFAIADWDLAKLQRIAPVLEPLAGLATPISGSIQLTIDTASMRAEGARVDLTARRGSIVHPVLVDGKLPIAGAQLKVSYDTALARLTLHEFSLDLGGPTVTVKGTVDGFDAHRLLVGEATGELAVAAEIVARKMPTNDLARYWPPTLAVNARNWVTTNIHDGAVDEATLSTRLRVKPDGAVGAPDAFGGTLKMHGLTVDYKNPLPVVRGVDGTATFDQRRMTLLPTSGTLKGLRVTGGTIVITDLDVVDQWINIAVDVTGPVRDALETIDAKPLEYARRVGLDPARVDGTADAHLSFYFMLDRRTTFEQVELGVKAQLAGVALRKVAFEQDLTEASLQLRLDRGSLELNGTGKLAGAPATIGWLQYFKPRDGLRSRYTVQTTVDAAVRKAIGLEPPDGMLAGPLGIAATVKSFADKRGAVSLALDLKGATIAVPDLNWSKEAGRPAKANLELDLVDDHLAGISSASANGPGIEVDGLTATFDTGDTSLRRIEVARLALGATDLKGSVARRSAGGWRIELQGSSLDATAFTNNLNRPGGSVDKEQPPLVVDAKFDRVILGPNREAANVVLQLRSDVLHWQSVRLDAAPFGAGSLKLTFGEAGGLRPFNLTTNDLGATLRLLDVSDHVAGGQLTISGQAEDEGATRTFVGHLDGGDYRMVRAPVLAKLLAIASFASIGSLLSGEGIPFTRLTGDFRASGGKIAVKGFRAYGGAIGLNASGTLDLDASTLNLDGTLVPAYTLNSILGNIPVIGDLLLGGKGQGIFAAGFHAEGPLDDPKISVNPLSALAPGVLRNLFLFDSSSSNGQTPPRPSTETK